jgi:hypothetical protein
MIKMKNSYLGISNSKFILYFSQVEIDLELLANQFKSIQCKDMYFDGIEEKKIHNTRYESFEFANLLNSNNPFVEYDLIFDDIYLVKNIWWDDIFIEGPNSKLNELLYILERSNVIDTNNRKGLLDKINSYKGQVFAPRTFKAYIHDSDRYLDFINN